MIFIAEVLNRINFKISRLVTFYIVLYYYILYWRNGIYTSAMTDANFFFYRQIN